MRHTIVLGKHNFELYSNIVEISTEGKGSLTLDEKTYTIYDDFVSIKALAASENGQYLDTQISLKLNRIFQASMNKETYQEIQSLIEKRG